jgi:hypothetical protein
MHDFLLKQVQVQLHEKHFTEDEADVIVGILQQAGKVQGFIPVQQQEPAVPGEDPILKAAQNVVKSSKEYGKPKLQKLITFPNFPIDSKTVTVTKSSRPRSRRRSST